MTSISLAAWNVFLLPLDVANQKGLVAANGAGIPMGKITLAFYATSILLVCVVIPFTSYYYEGEDNTDSADGAETSSSSHQIGYALKWTIPTLLVFAGIIAAMYWGGLGYATINTTYLQSPLFDTTDIEASSLDSFFTLKFYCNATAMGKPLILTPKNPLVPITYTPTPIGTTGSPLLGCQSLTGSPVFKIE